jgi:hypothetical protein
MKEIDEMLNRWIHNSIIRKQLKELIIKVIKNEQKKGKYK